MSMDDGTIMKRPAWVTPAILGVALLACLPSTNEAGGGERITASLVRLLANPQPLHGKPVITFGFASSTHPGLLAVYLSEADAEYDTRVNAIWVDEQEIPLSLLPISRYDGQWIMVEGPLGTGGTARSRLERSKR